jgi:chemotaxis-related protein WspB
MLVLQFYLGDVMYVIKCNRVKEVAPMVALKKMPNAPDCVAGLFNYRGMIVPVIDLRQLIHGSLCQLRLSTRIILVDSFRKDNTPYVFGIMAERITEAVNKPESDFVPAGIVMEEAPYLGGIMMENKEMVQFIDIDRLSESLKFLPMLGNGIENVAENN